jgi:uncharacterized protein (DUF58 family)
MPPAGARAGVGRRRLRPTPAARAVAALAAAGVPAGLATGQRPVLVGALALALLVALDAVSAWRAMPSEPVGMRPLGDGTVGAPVNYQITVAPARRPVTVARRHGPGAAVLVPAATGAAVTMVARAGLAAPRRGIFPAEAFTVAARGPLGLMACGRHVIVGHAPALAIGPAPVAHDLRWPVPSAAATGGECRAPRGDDLVRGVRAYVRGDARRSIHWPATARHRTLMVRETEGMGVRTLRLVVSYAEPGEAAERALGRAAWMAGEAHRNGWRVWLVTCGPPSPGAPGGTVERAVEGPDDILRRLAAAGPGRPGTDPSARRPFATDPTATRWITPTGDRWR